METTKFDEVHQAYQHGDSSQNSASPCYLHPRDNLEIILVPPPVDKGNCYSWRRSMNRVLLWKNTFKFMSGSIRMPQQL
ncbi:putative gag-polypeptide of LTR copia-type [Lupinus albus]|uniref:Putative gag-polypeptide of LTR copia-type n=1 Tax=Lupinus albus TaxID=3870 RepID=A0A6A4NQB3_LUPAL|nr:putative gag-polypeptide of LTR copia-type [Lupinus albus]